MTTPNFNDFIGSVLISVMRPHRYQIDSALNQIGLHVGQELVLFSLWREEGLSQSEIAKDLCVSAPTVTKMLTSMEAEGIIERRADEEDGRVSRIYLTERGRTLQTEVVAIWSAIEQEMMQGISEAEKLLLRRLLLQMRDNLSADNG